MNGSVSAIGDLDKNSSIDLLAIGAISILAIHSKVCRATIYIVRIVFVVFISFYDIVGVFRSNILDSN